MNDLSAGRAPLGRLSLMMFLEYAVWGAWLPVAARYLSADLTAGGLGFTDVQIGMILGLAGSVGALAAPFIAGQIADRFFRAERFLALLMLVGGGIKWYTASRTDYDSWLWLSIAYSVVYMPTLALTNSIAFAHVGDRERDFPRVRVWGTIGWIAASWVFPMLYLQRELGVSWMPPFLSGPEVEGATARLAEALRFSALISVGLAVYCLTLPATPPREDRDEVAVTKAFALFTRPSLAVLLLCGLTIAVIHQIYFLQAGPFLSEIGVPDSKIGPAMTVGQFSEILVLAALGLLLKGLGLRNVLTLGAFAYFLRYWIWSHPEWPVSVLVGSQALHGFCYACFFAAAYIYVDRVAPVDVRHSAQTVFGIVMLGGGPVLGGYLSGWLGERYGSLAGPDSVGEQFAPLWRTLGWIGLGVALVLLLLFREQARDDAEEPAPAG